MHSGKNDSDSLIDNLDRFKCAELMVLLCRTTQLNTQHPDQPQLSRIMCVLKETNTFQLPIKSISKIMHTNILFAEVFANIVFYAPREWQNLVEFVVDNSGEGLQTEHVHEHWSKLV